MTKLYPTVLSPATTGLETGDPELSIVGTGTSIPWGIDAVFQYRGLTFNVRDTVDKIRVTSIEGLDDADIRDTREDNPAEDGETAYDSNYGGRTLVFNGRFEAFQRDKLRDMQQAFRTAFIDIKNEYPLYFITNNPDTYHYINCKKSTKLQWSEEQKTHGVYYRDFQLTLRASNPSFLLMKQEFASWIPPTGATITNFGNYKTYPVMNLFGDMDTVEFLVDFPDETSRTFKLLSDVVIAEGDFYRVDFYNRTIIDSTGANVFSDVDPESDFFSLPAGTSYISIPTGKSNVTGSGAMDITFPNAYL